MLKLLIKIIPWLTLSGLLFLWASHPSFLEITKLKNFDFYQQLMPRKASTEAPVVIIDIDEKSLKSIGQWPWPRTTVAALVEQVFHAKASALAFDIVFAEADRTSPDLVVKNWPIPRAEKIKLSKLPRNDAIFTESLANKSVIMGYALDNNPTPQAENDFDIFSDVTGSKLENLPVPQVNSLIRNLAEIEDSAPALGWFGYIPDQDNVVRRLPMLIRYQDAVFAPLSIKLLRAHSKTRTLEPVRDAYGTMEGIKFGTYKVPTAGDSSFWIHFRPYNNQNFVSAVDVLQGKVGKDILENKMVIIGTSAEGLLDFRATPLQTKVPGVDMHAQVIENILDNRFIKRPAWLPPAELIVTAMLGIILLLAGQFFSATASTLVMLCIISLITVSGISAFYYGWLIESMVPVALLLVTTLVQILLRYGQEEKQRKAIRGAFSHYLSPEMVKVVSKNPEQLKLGGEQKELTVLFSDIRDFTSLSEGLNPTELTSLINNYLTPMTDIIMQTNGTIDKYMGDAIMAFWNAPLNVPQHPLATCRAALSMLTKLDELNVEWRKLGRPQLKVGIGIHTGVATVGNMGSTQRFDYTVMGDTVNLASRLEGLCKAYGVTTVVSKNVVTSVPNGTFMPLDKVIVKGKTEPVEVFELLSLKDVSPKIKAEITAITNGIKAFRQKDWNVAISYFKESTKHEVLKELYLTRIANYKKSPPPTNWNGAWERRSK